MNYIKNLPAERVIKIHIVWRILGLLLWWGGYPYDTAGLTGQGFGILFAVFVLVGLQNDNFYSKWLWYIFTVFSTGTFISYSSVKKFLITISLHFQYI